MARAFDNAYTQYLSYPAAIVDEVPITLAAWVRLDDKDAGHDIVTLGYSLSNNTFFRLLYSYGTDSISAIAKTNVSLFGQADTTASPSVGTWNHTCGVFPAANSRSAYLNGGNKGTNLYNVGTPLVDRTSVGTVITNGSPLAATLMDGSIAHPAIWNEALTDHEVRLLYLGYLPSQIRPWALVGWWPLNGDDRNYAPKTRQLYYMSAYNSPTYTTGPQNVRVYPDRVWRAIAIQGGGLIPLIATYYARLRGA